MGVLIKQWNSALDAPTIRITRRIYAQLDKLEQQLTTRLKIMEVRWGKLQDAYRHFYDEEDRTGEEMPVRGKRVGELSARAEKTYHELEWRLQEVKKIETTLEEIEDSVQKMV